MMGRGITETYVRMLDVPVWFLSAVRASEWNYLGITRLGFRAIIVVFDDALRDQEAIEYFELPLQVSLILFQPLVRMDWSLKCAAWIKRSKCKVDLVLSAKRWRSGKPTRQSIICLVLAAASLCLDHFPNVSGDGEIECRAYVAWAILPRAFSESCQCDWFAGKQ